MARCEKDQSWSGVLPTCVEVTCSPPLVENVDSVSPEPDSYKDVYSYGEVMSFSCPGVEYRLVGSTEMMCGDDGQWIGSVPACHLVLCPPLDVNHGKIVVTADTSSFPYNAVGSEITVECDDGYHVENATTAISCTLDGSWSADLVTTCERTLCPDPMIINGRTTVVADDDELAVGVQVHIICDGGFLLPVGAPSYVECTESGQWSDMLPTCIRVRCPPVRVDGARIIVNQTAVENLSAIYLYDDEVQVECLIGHSLVGHRLLTCESTGAWSHQLPVCEPVRCPDPGVPHASVQVLGLPPGVSVNYTFGVVISFVCDDGYQISGSTSNLCLGDGTWDAPFPRCDPKLCPELSIANANVDYRDREYGARVRVSCDDGYEMFGDAVLVCQASGLWSGVSPVCAQITCTLPLVADGRIVGNSATSDGVAMKYGDQIIVQCHEGFELIGDSHLTCAMNKTWTPAAPRCRRVQCDDPLTSPVPHLKLNVTRRPELNTDARQFVYDTQVTFACEMGFRLVGVSSITCSETAQWSSSTRPTCDPVYCPPPHIANGHIDTQSSNDTYMFGDGINFRCDAGFVPAGETEIFCQPNGDWTDEFPVCERRSCPPVPDIDHGSVVVTRSPKFQDVAIYSCTVGYQLVGGNNATCNEAGRWTQRPSCLLVRCPPPESVPHGTYMPTGSTYGSVLRYACNRGYELHGDADHMCQANGSWSGDVPVCRRIRCVQPPPRIPHADLVGSVPTQFGDGLSVSCHEGYRLAGLPTVECLWNGSWSRVVSSCNIITCGPPPYVRHAIAAGSQRHEYNSTVRYVCKPGYRLRGPVNSSVCLANGSWSEVRVECVIVRCPSPVIPDGGQIIVNRGHPVSDSDQLERLHPEGFQYGDRVWVSCDVRRELHGAGFRICGPGGRWNGTEPECRRIECRLPPFLSNVVYDYHTAESLSRRFYVGHVVDVSCDVGFHVVDGHHKIICQTNSSWNVSVSSSPCQRTVCPSPPDVARGHFVIVQGGKVTDDEFDFRTTVSYSCQPGYALVGERRMTCGEGGRWSQINDPPSCTVINCSRLEPPENGQVVGDGHSFGSTVDFYCDRGYNLVGVSRIKCRHDGHWNGSAPVCRIVSCGPPPRMLHASVSVNSTIYGSVAYYHCHSGFEHTTSESNLIDRICDSAGLWAGPEVTCRRIKCPDPPQPEHGYYSGSEFLFEAVVTYRCRGGYKLVGERRRRCLANKTWSGTIPVCRRRECPTPLAPVNGRISSSVVTTVSGSVLEFECDLGYRLVGSGTVECTEDETWNSAFPSCELVSCGQPPTVDHADLDSLAFSYDHVVQYVCRRGFRRSGPGSVRCQADGTWNADGGPTVCERVRCGAPPRVQHASVVETGLRYGDVVYYVCDDGYDLNGNNLLECDADGRWSGHLPRCEMVTCGPAPVIPHATTIVRRTTLGSRASYVCNRGYVLTGSPYVECKPNRTWSYMDRPTCLPVDCGSPPAPVSPSTLVRYNTTVFKDTAVYYCQNGFRFEESSRDEAGSILVMCGENGTWNITGSGPVCGPVSCPALSAPVNGRVRIVRDGQDRGVGGARATFGDEAEFSCDAGYRLIGDVTVTCQSDGTWSGTDQPICHGN